MMVKGKKAEGIWIAWVILVGMVVVMSAFVARFYIDSARSSSETVRGFLQDTEVCSSVALSVVDSCQFPEALNIEVANIRSTKVDKVVFRIFDAASDSESINVDALIEPGSSRNLTIGKSRMAAKVDVIPLVEDGNSTVICSSRTVELDSIRDC